MFGEDTTSHNSSVEHPQHTPHDTLLGELPLLEARELASLEAQMFKLAQRMTVVAQRQLRLREQWAAAHDRAAAIRRRLADRKDSPRCHRCSQLLNAKEEGGM